MEHSKDYSKTKKVLILGFILLLMPIVMAASFPPSGLNPYHSNLSEFINQSLNLSTGLLKPDLDVKINSLNITTNLIVLGNINVTKINASNLTGGLSCSYMTGANYNVCVGDGGSNFRLENVSNNTLTKDDNITSSLWNISGLNIFLRYISGFVGIGTSTPNYALEVIGNASFRGNFTINNTINFTSTDGSGRFAGKIYSEGLEINKSISLDNYQKITPAFSLTNYSAEYGSTGYKIVNFTDEYGRSGFKTGVNDTRFLINNSYVNITSLNVNNNITMSRYNMSILVGNGSCGMTWNESAIWLGCGGSKVGVRLY